MEKLLHLIFDTYRKNKNREFFEVSAEQVKLTLELLKHSEASLDTEEEKEVEEIAQTIDTKAQWDFSYIGIKVGEVLTLRTNREITCLVAENNMVEYEGEFYTITGLAKKLLPEITYNISGSKWWLYKGKKLSRLRREKEKELELEQESE